MTDLQMKLRDVGPAMGQAPNLDAQDDTAPWIDQRDIDRREIDKFGPQLASRLQSWRDEGYVVIKGGVPAETIEHYIDELRHIRADPHRYLMQVECAGQTTWTRALAPHAFDAADFRYHHHHVASVHAARIALAGPITAFLAAVFKSPPVPLQSLTYLKAQAQKPALHCQTVTSQRRKLMLASAWIVLDDGDAHSGAPCWYPGAHRSGQAGGPELTAALGAQGFARTRLDARRGDVVIRHAAMPCAIEDSAPPGGRMMGLLVHYTGLWDFPARWLPAPQDAASTGLSLNGGHIIEFPWDLQKQDTKLASWAERGCLRGEQSGVATAMAQLAGASPAKAGLVRTPPGTSRPFSLRTMAAAFRSLRASGAAGSLPLEWGSGLTRDQLRRRTGAYLVSQGWAVEDRRSHPFAMVITRGTWQAMLTFLPAGTYFCRSLRQDLSELARTLDPLPMITVTADPLPAGYEEEARQSRVFILNYRALDTLGPTH